VGRKANERGCIELTSMLYFTTLVEGNRLADRYLRALANGGKLVYRSIDEHRETFDQLGISLRWDVDGNMASFFYGD